MPSPEQIERLPKWAQDHLRRLESDLRRATEALDLLSGKSEGSPISYGYNSRGQARGHIPHGPVHFALGEVRITANVPHDGTQELTIQGGDTIELIPVAANSVKIRPGKF